MKIDYKEIKRMLPIERVLNEYGLINDLKKNQSKLYGKCPIHKGDNESAFHVDLNKNLWNCFTHCGGGSVIDLLMKIEKTDVYNAGLLGEKLLRSNKEEKYLCKRNQPTKKNKPLEFRLKLDSDHSYISERNISKETANFFGIGYSSKGIMKGRIAIPIHDIRNNLIAYCGRAIDNKQPKYIFPFGFKKSEIVYNLNRVTKSDNTKLVIVEGFFDVYRLYQARINGVAIMGSSISNNQIQQLKNLEKELIFMFDGDIAGKKGMQKALDMIGDSSKVRATYLHNNIQPDNLTEEELKTLIL